uniref:Benzoate carboxyl methyltransferase n=1 Tax=Zea mays TaxID=4577 RepID=B6TBS9_MAIZE|nr:benzoate carboxyl methyltransferase [Zea mays]|eukprot:NP_001149207.1 benzoate carboxyl methyltransferase [Zea mays]
MDIRRDFHMAEGEGEWSYSKNCRRQQVAVRETRPMVETAVKQVYAALLPRTMVVADLGCSAGPNTLLFISSVLSSIAAAAGAERCKPPSGGGDDDDHHVELQFVLNDLPGNDFNHLFRSVEEEFRRAAGCERGPPPPPYYVMGLPESYYNRLFPRQSVHLFHSSYCLHWRSQEPEGLEAWRKPCLNEDNIYIARSRTTTPSVAKLFQEQFQKDFSLFLKLRHEELVHGGRMVLVFLGRKNEDAYSGDLNQLFALVATALQSLVLKGLVEKEKLESFNLPIYGPSVGEVEDLVTQSGLFSMDLIKQFEMNWDPLDDSEGDDVVEDSARSSMNVAKYIRSVLKSLIVRHFGEAIIDAWFAEFRRLVAEHLEKEKTKFTTFAMCLKKE